MAAGNSYCLGIKSNDFFLKDNKKAFILWLNVPKVTAYQQAANIFLEAISDELTGKQVKELKAALSEEKGGKKGPLMEKVKSFGLDTLSNIVANIVTNPAIWG